MTDASIAVVSPGRTSSGGSAFAAGLVPALRRRLGDELVIEASAPSVGRMSLSPEVCRARTVLFAGSRAVSVPGALTIFWPLNVAPFEKHVARAQSSSVKNRLRHVALLRRLGRSVAAVDGLVFGSLHARTLYQAAYPLGAVKPYSINRGGTSSGLTLAARRETQSPLVLLVSHLYPYKGILEFVEAVGQATRQLPRDVRFRVAGADRDPVYAREVHHRVSQLGLGSRFVVAPADLVEMGELYAEATLSVFASTCENAGSFALYDALHAGVPVLCSDRSSMPEMAGDYVQLVNPCEPDKMARAITELLSDGAAREELGDRARTWSAAAPTWDDRAGLLIDFVESLGRN